MSDDQRPSAWDKWPDFWTLLRDESEWDAWAKKHERSGEVGSGVWSFKPRSFPALIVGQAYDAVAVVHVEDALRLLTGGADWRALVDATDDLNRDGNYVSVAAMTDILDRKEAEAMGLALLAYARSKG